MRPASVLCDVGTRAAMRSYTVRSTFGTRFFSRPDNPESNEALGGCDDRVLAGPWSPSE
jgi:hypothetical protein